MRKLFITGSSGCVGHYLLDILLTQPQTEIHLLLRPSSRLKFDISQYQNVVIHHGNMDAIEELASVIAEMDYIIHIFTDWSDSEYATLLNVTKTQALFAMANPDRIKRIIYFSTASILGPGNKPIWQAEKYGPGYVRSKYQGHNELPKNPNYHKVVTVFPTLVFGGDKTHPYSHMSSGILPNLNYLKWIRFFYLDARFHFLHSKDIASVVVHLLDIPNPAKEYVLGNPVMTGKDAI
ncbi:NAD(P)-dependent oxidoreductase, partial [bacterium]|nr:NAD(P)-dependent oxidoreductase [bacterium]